MNEGIGTRYYYCLVTNSKYGDHVSISSDPVKVTIKQGSKPDPKPVKVKSVSLNKKNISLECGQTITLKATVSPSNAADKTLTWSVKNTKVATVSKNGVVTGKGGGTTTLTVKSSNGKKATCKINVKEYKDIKHLYVLPANLTLKAGKTKQLKVCFFPSKVKNKRVYYKTGNSKVALVSKTGKVTAVKKGTTYITVTTADGKKSRRIRVTVKK